MLRKYRPEVIFEWHPSLCLKAGNSPETHFEVLAKEGYSRFVFFTKHGEFSHFMSGFDRTAIENLVAYCVDAEAPADWHYDIIALHEKSFLSPSALAVARFARTKLSPF